MYAGMVNTWTHVTFMNFHEELPLYRGCRHLFIFLSDNDNLADVKL